MPERRIGTGTPLEDGTDLGLHLANPNLIPYADLKKGKAEALEAVAMSYPETSGTRNGAAGAAIISLVDQPPFVEVAKPLPQREVFEVGNNLIVLRKRKAA